MFKSKHSGWTWELKRTPYGGGGFGGIGNFFASIDPGPSIGSSLASIDPGPAIGQGLAEADTFVNRELPGGWALPAIIAAAYLTGGASLGADAAAEGGAAAGAAEGGAGAGDVFAGYSAGGSSAGTAGGTIGSYGSTAGYGTVAGATEAGQAAYDSALANGATETEAQVAGNQAASSYSNVPLDTSTPGANSVLSQPDVTVNLGSTNTGTVGSLNPALPAVGAPEGTSIGMSAQLPPGTVLGTGLPGGGVAGVSYAAGPNGLPATDFFGNYVPASSINFGGVPSTVAGTSYNLDTLKELNKARGGLNTANNLAKMLSQGSLSGLSGSLGKLAQGANPAPLGLVNAVRGNANPFAQEQYFQVSKPKSDLAELVQLLKQG